MFGRKPSSHGFNFTDRVRRILQMAREEAVRLHHGYVGPQHLLLGLIRDGEGVAAAVLTNLDVDFEELAQKVNASLEQGKDTRRGMGDDLPYTSRAKNVLELAMSEARELDHSYIGSEHLLLGLLRERKGIAAEVLTAAGVTLDLARVETLRLLGAGDVAGTKPSLDIEIDDASDRSIYEQVVERVQEAVATGQLRPGDRLPTVRQLADQLDIAPGTVARAYAELERRGIVVTDGARGTKVAGRVRPPVSDPQRPESLVGLLRPVVVAAYHLGATAAELKGALDEAMRGIFGDKGKPDAA